MKSKLAIFVTVLTSLVMAGTASAYSDYDGGGSSTPSHYTLVSITYRSDGFPIFLYCDYLDFGNGLVIQNGCHS